MARETKIGLLVGMGFIVCFAIILSNRGGETRTDPSLSTHGLAPVSDRPATAGAAERRARDYGRKPRIEQDRSTDPAPRPIPTAVGASDTPADEPPRPSLPSPLPVPADTPDPDVASPEMDRSLDAGDSEPTTEPVNDTEPPTPPAEAEGTPSTKAIAPQAQAAKPLVPVKTTEYVVKRGESLSKIGRLAYGSCKKVFTDGIFAANRDRLPSPNQVRAGQTLRLPVIEGVSPKIEPAPENKPPSRSTQPPAKTKPSWRWYQIKKGDRYSTIAEREMGDRTRWREIYELNKDIFPDAAHIRWGVRIRIPIDPKR
ncbi:MAG: LysM peptidoglycan-binding domain-containing protein [Phycisphaerales bacterium]|nr:MAG: LysM peptidoglycan-binding domain-containing protein [Phycisphaerales bacterium]